MRRWWWGKGVGGGEGYWKTVWILTVKPVQRSADASCLLTGYQAGGSCSAGHHPPLPRWPTTRLLAKIHRNPPSKLMSPHCVGPKICWTSVMNCCSREVIVQSAVNLPSHRASSHFFSLLLLLLLLHSFGPRGSSCGGVPLSYLESFCFLSTIVRQTDILKKNRNPLS